jgi:hypothetical protein
MLKNIIARAKGTLSTVEFRKDGINHRIFVDGKPIKVVFSLESVLAAERASKKFGSTPTNLVDALMKSFRDVVRDETGKLIPVVTFSAALKKAATP